MKYSSSSLLITLLLAQLPLLASSVPVHPPRHVSEILTNQTRHLLKLTQDLLNNHMIKADVVHRFKSLPVITRKAADLSSLEVKSTLSQLHADLKNFELHFEWLNQASKKPKIICSKFKEMIHFLKLLISNIEQQMAKLAVNRLPHPSTSLPTGVEEWDVVQSSLELLQKFRLYCDWALRTFLALKLKN